MAFDFFRLGQVALPQKSLWTISLCVFLILSGCISPVEYGKIPHSDYVANDTCNPVPSGSDLNADTPHFLVTSRLPDCRNERVKLLNHRGDKVRYGRFGAPADIVNEKGKNQKSIPFSLTNEDQWWQQLSETMSNQNGRVLLYVHGYRETFYTTSRDAAQIARLTGFAGPVIQYSWPSQGEVFKYAADETNSYWDERNFRRFLMRLAQQPWTKEIDVVAHSLGARIVLPAIEFVDRNSANADSSNISNIILASPDVDRQDFENDIAGAILTASRVNKDRHITVYASIRDKALALSYALHGYPRLGRPDCFDPFKAKELKGQGLPERCYASKTSYDVAPEKSGLTMVDTSAISQGTTGHSDYLQSAAACLDFAATINGARKRSERAPTKLQHVFTLPAYAKGEQPDHLAVCQRRVE